MSSTIPAVPWPHALPPYPQATRPLPEYKSLADVEIEQLRLDLAANRATLAGYAGELALAKAELQRLQGHGLKPQAGCLIAEMALGDSAAMVEYEYEPGQRGCMYQRNGDPGYPDEPANVNIVSVLVNGRMVDADNFADAVLEKWVEAILDSDQGDA
jgi:hypothetical protein